MTLFPECTHSRMTADIMQHIIDYWLILHACRTASQAAHIRQGGRYRFKTMGIIHYRPRIVGVAEEMIVLQECIAYFTRKISH